MTLDEHHHDLVVIGSGPAGQKAAICAAKLGKRVAIVDRKHSMGGVCVHTGTIPSKTLREAVMHLSGVRQRTYYGRYYQVKEAISVQDLAYRVKHIITCEVDVVNNQLYRNRITTYGGWATFDDPHTLRVESDSGVTRVRGEHILVGCGTRPAHGSIELDGQQIFDSDQLLQLDEIPRDVIIVGAGVIGLEYAAMLSALGTRCTIIDGREQLLPFVDRELMETLSYQLRHQGAVFRLGENVVSVAKDGRGRVEARLESGKAVHGEALLYSAGRQANTDKLNIEAAGLKADGRGRLRVNASFQTDVPHIYAAGDVIGFPSLASASMEQGRLASLSMFGEQAVSRPDLIPYGIYTIPEISMVGKSEEELTSAKVPYEVGVARFEELSRGQMLGDDKGLLKLLFCPRTLKLHGVHVIGEGAVEIVHIGMTLMAMEGTIEFFRDAVFNYPTLSTAYKVAALDGLNRL